MTTSRFADEYNNRVLEFFEPFGSVTATPMSTPAAATPIATATPTSILAPTATATSSGLISVIPTVVAFATTKVGRTSQRTVTIKNTALTPLSGAVESAIDAPFTIFSGAGPFTLAKGKTHAIKLTFSPTSATGFHSAITIDSSDQGKSPFTVSISGSGK
jgi:hypothetical protein